MFIELIEPQAVDLYVTKDRVKIRLREPGAPGRIWLNLTYQNLKEAKAAISRLQVILERGAVEYTGSKDVQIQVESATVTEWNPSDPVWPPPK